MKLIGSIIGRLPGGPPRLVNRDGEEELSITYAVDASELDTLPVIGSFFDDHRYSWFAGRGLILRTMTLTPRTGGTIYDAELRYAKPEVDDGTGSGGADLFSETEYRTQDTDVPLELHPGYRTCWNHVLLSPISELSVPDWYQNRTSTALLSSEAEHYRWAKPGDKPPEGWRVLKAETMPGVESFRSGITTVTHIVRSRNKRRLERDAERDYTIQNPPDTFGKGGVWLRGGSSIRREGKYWVLTVQYLNSEALASELYSSK